LEKKVGGDRFRESWVPTSERESTHIEVSLLNKGKNKPAPGGGKVDRNLKVGKKLLGKGKKF